LSLAHVLRYANLNPEPYDVDLGATVGAPFGTVAVGDTFSVAVRVAGDPSLDVTAFQVRGRDIGHSDKRALVRNFAFR
jgi:hypothetical protein